MKQTIKYLFIGLMATSVFVACDKSEDPIPPPTKTQKITGTWMTTAITVNPAKNQNGVPVTDWYSGQDPCDKDDKNTFEADGYYELDNGSKNCNSLNEKIQPGKWGFNVSETVLTITDSASALAVDLNLTQLSSRLMTVEYSEFDNKVLYIFTETLEKQ